MLASRFKLKYSKHRKPAEIRKVFEVYELMVTWHMIFRDTLLSKLIFLIENCCLCTCFTELYVFYWLLVVSFSI